MKDGKKVLGVIGGMGPLASQLFYKMIIENTRVQKDQDHIDMVILNHASMPDRTESIACNKTGRLLDKLEEDVLFLEKGGADYGVISCNTCHVLMEELKKKTKLVMIDMIQTTAAHIVKIKGEGAKIGIMATDGTIKMELYQKALKQRGLVPIVPTVPKQKLVMKIIYQGIKGGRPINYREFEQVENQFRHQQCECVIMACTELSCLKEWYSLSDYFVDPMEVTANEAIKLCGRKVREKRNDSNTAFAE